jgi:hypothetical protein
LYLPVAEYEKSVYKPMLASVPSALPNGLKDSLKSRLKYGNEFSLRRRFQSLISEIGGKTSKLIGWDDPKFLDKMINTRNVLTHQTSDASLAVFNPDELYECNIRLVMLYATLAFRHLEFDDEMIQSALKRNPTWESRLSMESEGVEMTIGHTDGTGERPLP